MAAMGGDSRPALSILCSVWNEEKYLVAMVESILEQDFTDWELLLVDDGSTDSTADLIRELAARDDRVVAVSLGKKLGKANAFNLAFEHSSGRVIMLMGGDDIVPTGALRRRFEIFSTEELEIPAAGYFKLHSFSDDPKFDDMLIPRGTAGSRSGPGLTLTRPLADVCFPTPTELPNEDSWIGAVSDLVAQVKHDSPHASVRYRIHADNSNPRHKSFDKMNEAIHARAQTPRLILESGRFALSDDQVANLTVQARAEELRYAGDVLGLLRLKNLALIDRVANASMAKPVLWKIRTKFYRYLTGWRGR